MLPPSASFFLTVSSLLLSVAAFPHDLQTRGQNVIIGYRTVRQPEYESLEANNWVLKYSEKSSGTQTGDGIYTSPGPNDWLASYAKCVIYADPTKWAAVNKVWAQPQYNCKALWYTYASSGDAVMNAYLSNFGSGFTASNTVLLSNIANHVPAQQALIPAGMASSIGGTVQCAKTTDTEGLALIESLVKVDYASWNPLGTPQDPNVNQIYRTGATTT